METLCCWLPPSVQLKVGDYGVLVISEEGNKAASFIPVHSADVVAASLINEISPLEITVGTRSIITISGSGLGAEQSTSYVSFRNADDGVQSFMEPDTGPHYVSGRILIDGSVIKNKTLVDTQHLSSGVYLLTVESQNARSVSKMIKN